jgi:hypothetical protein
MVFAMLRGALASSLLLVAGCKTTPAVPVEPLKDPPDPIVDPKPDPKPDPLPDSSNPYLKGAHLWNSNGLLSSNTLKRGENFLSDLTITTASNGWGPLERDTSNGEELPADGKAIVVAGKTYAKGLGVHAPSEVRFDLKGSCMNFSSTIGLDDEIDTQNQYGKVIFKVFVDGQEKFNSGVLNTNDVKSLNLDVRGKQELRLVVDQAGDNNWFDHANWANPVLACMVASAGSSPGFNAGPEAASKGAFGPVQNWPTVAVNSALLSSGKVLGWLSQDNNGDYRDDVNAPHNSTQAWQWDPINNQFSNANNPFTDLFCAGAASNFNGKLIVAGGNLGGRFGSRDVNTFDATTSQWSKTGTMAQGRWYPTVTALPNREMLVIGGNKDTAPVQPNVIPDVIQTDGSIRRLSGASSLGLPAWNATVEDEHYYPWMHVAPNGKVFYAGPHSRMVSLDTGGTGAWSNPNERGDGLFRKYGSSVKYDIGKILVLGGGPGVCPVGACGYASTRVIDLNSGLQSRAVPDMKYKRVHANATVLPDGRVIVIGGSQNGNVAGYNFDDTQSVLESELWSPGTEAFKPAATMQTPRNYHSSALLLPDGRVLSTGGGGCGDGCPQNHYNAEIYYPPYLFKTDGSGKLAERPVIVQAPQFIGYDAGFDVSSIDAAITSSAVLMHLGSATHAFDQGQFRVPLQIESRGGGVLGLRSPANANIAPPGVYMLFIIDAAGVPSVAKMIKLQ